LANGHLNVANDFVFKFLKIQLFWTKQYKNKDILFNSLLKLQNSVKSDGPGCKICHVGHISHKKMLFCYVKKKLPNGLIYSEQLL